MLKRCCCFNLYVGSLIIAVLRLLLWALLLIAIIYVAVQIFSPDNGLVPYRARVDIEQHSKTPILEFPESLDSPRQL